MAFTTRARSVSAGSEDGVEIPAGTGKTPTAMMALNNNDDWLGELNVGWPDDVEIASSSAGIESLGIEVTDENLKKLKGHDTICRFPQYRGFTFREIVLRDLEFTIWVMDTTQNHRALELRQFQAWINHFLKRTLDGLKIRNVDERAPPSFPLEAPMGTTLVRPQNPQCSGGCDWSYAGSNAYVEQKTCKKCGFREKNKKDAQRAAYRTENCPHDMTDKRGSSKKMSRVFCLQCQTFISEMPQAAARERKTAAEKVAQGTEDTVRSALTLVQQEDMKMPKRLAIECLKEVARQVNQFSDDEEVRASDLTKMLQDTMDSASLSARDPGVPPVAMMHWSRYYQDEWSNWEPENPMPVHGCPDLRVVDIMRDDGVWAILDEGCNMTCHSRSWRENAQQKLLNLGFTMEVLDAQKEYNGVGATATKSSSMFRIPFSVKPLDEKLRTLCGVIESYELEFENDNFVPLLSSLPNQATLGLMKDMRNGTAFLKDYQVEIELCKARQNNLLCINIGSLSEALKHRTKLPRNLRPLRVGSEEWIATYSGGERRCLMPPTSTTKSEKEIARTAREEFDKFTKRDPSTWTREEMKRFQEMEEKTFGLDAVTDIYPCHEPETYSPSSDGVDLQDLAQDSESATMVAYSRPEDDEVRKTGGGWKDNPKIKKPEEDFFRTVYIVSLGLDFEFTKRAKQRNGLGATLQMNQMWFHNYLKKNAPPGDPDWPLGQYSEESKRATNSLFDTLDWHLNGKNKKAQHSFWRHDPNDTVCAVLDCRTEKRVENAPHPGGGVAGTQSIIDDKELHERIKVLGDQIRAYTCNPDYHGRNMVIAVVGTGLGLGPEIRVARILHTIVGYAVE